MSSKTISAPVRRVMHVRCLLACGLLLTFMLVFAGPAGAAGVPAWKTTILTGQTPFSPSHQAACEVVYNTCDTYYVLLQNSGRASTSGEITITDQLPAGTELIAGANALELQNGEPVNGACNPETLTCTYSEPVRAGSWLLMKLRVKVLPGASPTLVDRALVSGGEAAAAQAERETAVSETAPQFGFNAFSFEATGPTGAADLQGGDHPTLLTTALLLNSVPSTLGEFPGRSPEDVKDLLFYLPLGFLGNPQTAQKCRASLVASRESLISACPRSTQVGTVVPFVEGVSSLAPTSTGALGVYNIQPEAGFPAEFGFTDAGYTIVMYASVVRHEGAYMLRVSVPGVPRRAGLTGLLASFFGNISESVETETHKVGAFLTNPSDCQAGGLNAAVEANSWQQPESWIERSTVAYPKLEGCNLLGFPATLRAQPETTAADTPSGYAIGLAFPQPLNEFPSLATPPLKDVNITLPAGVALSPAAADGLGSCQATGPEGIDLPAGAAHAGEAGEGEALGPDGLARLTPGHCPPASQVASVTIHSPLLAEPLNGHVFLATPKCGGAGQAPCTEADAQNGNLFSLYLEAQAPTAGVNIKLAGTASVSPATGQVTVSFKDNPQFPVSSLEVHTVGGPRAAFANPQACGTATSTSDLAPWSAPFTPDATPTDSFQVDADGAGGVGGRECPSPAPFSPAFSAGTVSTAAGSYAPLTLRIARADGEQDLSALSVSLPPGLLGTLAGIPRCTEPQAGQGLCAAASRVGSVTAAVGAGSHPYYVHGEAFLTGPYKGAPFGLSVVVPAVAGPFNLGNVVVRAALYVDPSDAHITAVSDPLPQMIDGVPLRTRTIEVTIDRPGFTFNPTNCSQLQITGTVTSAQGTRASVSTPFAAGGCKNLPFKPAFTATTAGKASRAGGASLDVKVASRGGPQPGGGEANIKSVKVDLPKQLPSRLTTLQKACLAATFAANPASCPAAANVGTATASTPLLNVPPPGRGANLSGPAYLVSHGGEAFPDLEIVLQGEGITLILDGNTQIRKGITSSTFRTVPDAPISAFELKLPTGRYSVLGANVPQAARYSLCGQTLAMPTAITAQNGAVIKQSTKIAVTGCPKSKKAKAKTKAKAKKKHDASANRPKGR